MGAGNTIALIKALAKVDPETIQDSVNDWLDDHPEATTTVQDAAITTQKLNPSIRSALFETDDPDSLPIILFESGGMYGASGIEYDASTRSRSRFIPVKPGETITLVSHFLNGGTYTATVFQFGTNTKTTSDNNQIVTSVIDVTNSNGSFTVSNNTYFIRVQISQAVANVQKQVAILHESILEGVYSYSYTLTENDVEQGLYSTATGIPDLTTKSRLRTKHFYHVLPGMSVHFVPGTNIAEMIVFRRMSPNQGWSYSDWYTAETTYSLSPDYDIWIAFADSGHTANEITPDQFDCTVTITTEVHKNAIRYYPSMDVLLKEKGLQSGQYVKTLGFNCPGDNGGALYRVINTYDIADNCVCFKAEGDRLYLMRVFCEPYVYLESLNYRNVSYSVINDRINKNHIKDVRCDSIILDDTFTVGDYNFTFNMLTYYGTGTALVIDGLQFRKIRGDRIYAPNAEMAVKVTCTSQNAVQNIIEINHIDATNGHGLAIRPVSGHGIMHNHYHINVIHSDVVGMSTYIPAGTGTYSWEGEELVTLHQVDVSNSEGTGVGVLFKIEPDPEDGVTKDGTITGVTFTNLAVEGSDIGIECTCGTVNSNRVDACIKSIYVNNMRGRESGSTFKFLKGSGYIRDLYIKPTTPVQIHQFDFMTGSGANPCVVDAPIMWGYHLYIFGWGLRFMLGQTYVAKRMVGAYNVTGDIDFSRFGNAPDAEHEPNWYAFFADEFKISPDLRGETVHLNLQYFWQESADGIKFLIPGALNGEAITVNATYMLPHKTVTITNNTPDDHLYQIDVKPQGREWDDDVAFSVRDLGTVSEEIVPWNYSGSGT